MGNLRVVVKRHWAAIIVALIVGSITVLPQFFLLADLGNNYKGIDIAGTDAEGYYLTRIRDAYDGHWSIASPDLYEYKNKAYSQPPLLESFEAVLAHMFGLNPMHMVTWGKFIFPLLLCLVFYTLFLYLTGYRLLAILAAATIILASNIVFHPLDIWRLLSGQWRALTDMVNYTRPINPQLSSLVFFSWLLIFYHWLRTQKKALLWPIIILLGLMFYTYLYAWSLAIGIVGMFFILAFFPRFRPTPLNPKVFLGIFIGAVIISIFYWLNFLQTLKDPAYNLLEQRFGFYHSRQPVWSNVLFLDFVVLFFWYRRRIKDLRFYLFLIIFISLSLLINEQVMTGIRFYPGHWHWYYITPLSIFFVLWFAYAKVICRWSIRLKYVFGILFLAFVFLNGIIHQYNGYSVVKETTMKAQKYAAIFDWLNKNSQSDDVVMASGVLNEDISLYTFDNNYFSRWGEFYLIPMERFRDRLYAQLYLAGANSSNIDQLVTSKNKSVFEYLFGRYKLRLADCGDHCFSDEELAGVKRDYLAFAPTVNFEEFLKKYKLNYVLWDPQEQPAWALDRFSFFHYITEINGVRIYQVI